MQGAGSPLTDWINSDVKTANTISIIMIIFAAWAGIEAITNVAGIEIPPETGMATNVDPDDTQRTNNGVIVGLGAVLGTVGVIIQVLIPRGETEEEIEDKGPVFDEDLVKLTKWLCSRGTTTAEFFEWADVDGSGSIDMVELANALRAAEIANLPPWEIEDLVKVMDINSDGRINLPELDITLLNIRNSLGIEFIPYVEEEPEVVEEEASESEETEDVAEADAEESESEEAEEAEEAAAEEIEESEVSKSTDSEETSDETDAEEESEEAEEADEEASEPDDAEATEEESEAVEEAEDDAGEEVEETESEEEASESDDAEATEEESGADEEAEEETKDDAGEEVEETESEEESSESDDAEATDEESEAVEETEDEGTDDAEVEVEEEIPKKKKKF